MANAFEDLLEKYSDKFLDELTSQNISTTNKDTKKPGSPVLFFSELDNKQYMGTYLSEYRDGYLVYSKYEAGNRASYSLLEDRRKVLTVGEVSYRSIFNHDVMVIKHMLDSGALLISNGKVVGQGNQNNIGDPAWYIEVIGSANEKVKEMQEPVVNEDVKFEYAMYIVMKGIISELSSVNIPTSIDPNKPVAITTKGNKAKYQQKDYYHMFMQLANRSGSELINSILKLNVRNYEEVIEFGKKLYDQTYNVDGIIDRRVFSSIMEKLISKILSNSSINVKIVQDISNGNFSSRSMQADVQPSTLTQEEINAKDNFEKKYGIKDGSLSYMLRQIYYTNSVSFMPSSALFEAELLVMDSKWNRFVASV